MCQLVSVRNHQVGLPLHFGFSWKHMAYICSVSCSEFFITVTVMISNQTQHIASDHAFFKVINRSVSGTDQQVKPRPLALCGCDSRIAVLSRNTSMTNYTMEQMFYYPVFLRLLCSAEHSH